MISMRQMLALQVIGFSVFLAIYASVNARRLRFDSIVQFPSLKVSETGSVPEDEYDEKQLWALVVAGSNGWYNYRHQADACHAYHLLKTHGVPESNIITMMYDDIAKNDENPYRGKIFNEPSGEDVYAGVKIDYSGINVSPENFLAVLTGNKSGIQGGSGRSIQSGPKDNIFVYFTDHGGVGIISFPDDVLTVKDLNAALNQMYKLKKYAKLVFYLEACESGSMFQKVLPNHINVYAVTASNSHESSWGCYCDNIMKLPCLGDCFSVNWMVDSETEDVNRETLKHQFQVVKQETNRSHVMHYGDLTISRDHVAEFIGQEVVARRLYRDRWTEYETEEWPAREIYPRFYKQKLIEAKTTGHRKLLQNKIDKIEMKREYLDSFMKAFLWSIVPQNERYRNIMYNKPHYVGNVDCFDELIKSFHKYCFHFSRNPYAMKYSYIFSNLCEKNVDIDIEEIKLKMFEKCLQIELQGIH